MLEEQLGSATYKGGVSVIRLENLNPIKCFFIIRYLALMKELQVGAPMILFGKELLRLMHTFSAQHYNKICLI